MTCLKPFSLFLLLASLCVLPAGAAPKRVDISQKGAVGDGTTFNTKAIQAVIDDCAKGGGTVVIPKGVFLSGALFLKPGVNVQFLAGGVLKGSTDINDYPKARTRIEGHFELWRAALLNADKADHLRITGPGTLDGSGAPFWKLFYDRREADRTTTNLSVERPRLCFIQNSADVQVRNISFLNSGFWNLHIYHNQNVTVDGCSFLAPSGAVPNDHAPSSDGIDVDSDQNVTISHCSFSVGDDDIALKGSKGPFALQDKDSPPVEHIRIQDCTFAAGGGIVTVGSEATLVRDVVVQRCKATGRLPIVRLKLRPDTPQDYEDIHCSDITLDGGGTFIEVAPWRQYFDLQGQPAPKSTVRNVTISNVHGAYGSLGQITGNPGDTISDITLSDVNVTLRSAALRANGVQGLKFTNVIVNGAPVSTPAAAPPPATP